MDTADQQWGPELDLALTGEVDLEHEADLAELRHTFEVSNCAHVVVDLSEVTFLDSTGLGFLYGLRSIAQSRGGHVAIRNPSSAAQVVMKIIAFDDLFEVRH